MAQRHHRLYLRPRCPVCRHPPPPLRPYLVAPPQSQSVVPEQSSDAMRTGVFRTRPASARLRKPVIYLYPSSSLPDVAVGLLPTSSWRFSAVYPPPQTASPSGEHHQTAQSLTWAVAAEPRGTCRGRRFLTCIGRRRRFVLDVVFD